jgi:hypothetical protein
VLVLGADAHEHVALAERLAQDAEQLDAPLERGHQLVDLREVLEAVLGDQPRGAVDVQRVLGGVGELAERRRELVEERALGRRQRRVGQALGEHPRAEAEAGELLVEVGVRPGRQAGVDRALEGEDPLRHAAGRGDDHDHQHLRLERQDLDVADRRGVDRRRGHHGEQVRDLAERLARGPHRLVDLAAHERQLERLARRRALDEQLVDEEAVALVGRDAPRRGVRVREEAVLLQEGELVADRRGPAAEVGVGRQRLRADRNTGTRGALDDLAEDSAPDAGSSSPTESRKRYDASTSASALRMIWLPACSATVSTVATSPATSLTFEVTTISLLGHAHAAELDAQALEGVRAAGRLGLARRPATWSTGRAGCARAGRPGLAKSSSMWIGL